MLGPPGRFTGFSTDQNLKSHFPEFTFSNKVSFIPGFFDPFYGSGCTLHLECRSVMCNGAEDNQAHRCDPYGLNAQEQPLFLVCSSITIFTPMDQVP